MAITLCQAAVMRTILLPEPTKPTIGVAPSVGTVDARNRSHILVIGAGIGGLAAALSLQRHGFRVSVYERAAELGEFGAGLLVTPNAMHALNFLGVGQAVAESSNAAGDLEFRHYKSGVVLHRRPVADVHTRYGAGIFQVHRADLHRALSFAVLANDPRCIHLNHELAYLSQGDSGVVAGFANGTIAEGDALIGCDGGRSVVREKVFSPEPVAYTGQVAYRAIVAVDELPEDIALRPRCLYLGPDRMLLHYALRQNALMNVVAVTRQRNWHEEHWALRGDISELSNLYDDFHPRVLAIIASIKPGALVKWGLHEREPLPYWTVGHVSLLGDAAHPFTPFLGQGACMAIEDGTVLGRCFAKARGPGEALKLYESARKQRANTAQLQSRERAKALQGPFVDNFDAERNAEDIGLFDGLFAYNPATTSIERDTMAIVEEQRQ